MANVRKSFNLRNGVQVDDDNFIVNPNGLVGIGTTIPEETLDVRGSIRVSGVLSTNNLVAGNIQTINALNAGITSITSGIITASSGVVTYYGDGSKLLNLPTSQWVDIDVGLGFTSIYAQGFVGVGTVDPRYLFQVGGNNDLNNFQTGVGINRTGDIFATGIITASSFSGSTFSGSGSALSDLNASNITSGTISVDRLPIIPEPNLPDSFQVAGIITALGGFSGVAFTAANLVPEARVDIQHIASQTAEIGISTVSTRLAVEGRIGVSTNSPQSDIHIVGGSSAALQVTATQSSILVGRGLNPTQNSGGLKFGNTSGLYPYSNTRTLDIINYDTGNVNYYIDYGISGSTDGNFNWIYGPGASNPLMTLSYQGNLGLGVTNPTSRLQVSGNINASSLNVTGSVAATGAGSSTSVRTLYILSGASGLLDANGNPIIVEGGNENVNITSGVSTFFDIQVTNTGIFDQRIGIGNTNPLGELHIGDYINDIENSIIITSSGVGFGTDLSTSEVYFDASSKNAVFGVVGVGTDDIDDNNILYVNGNTRLSGNVGIGTTNPTSALTVSGNTSLETLSVSGVSTFSGNIKTNNSNIVLGDGSGGNNRITLGTNNGLSFPNPDINCNIYYSSSYGNVIQDTTTSGVGGVQIWTGSGFSIKGQGGIGTQISSLQTGGVELYHYNSGAYSKTFETIGAGVTVTGTTFTNQLNVSGVSTLGIVTTGNIYSTGIVTATNGFTSGIGTAVEITTVGDQLIFTVPGVGTTSLTLF
jgi:hypothetical protein